MSHSILEPIGDGGVELKGFTNDIPMTSEIYKMYFKIAKEHGYKYVKVTRIKNDLPIVKIFKL